MFSPWKDLRMRYWERRSWMIVDQIYRPLISLIPTWFLPSTYGASVLYSWSGYLATHNYLKVRVMMVCKSITAQMADNARILMATRPFLRFCFYITFCGTNLNLVLFDRNGAIFLRTYDRVLIRTIRRLSCEITAYDLGLDTTVRPEGCLGSAQYPSYLGEILEETWSRSDGVPLWQSTSPLGRGTVMFNARPHSEPNGPL